MMASWQAMCVQVFTAGFAPSGFAPFGAPTWRRYVFGLL